MFLASQIPPLATHLSVTSYHHPYTFCFILFLLPQSILADMKVSRDVQEVLESPSFDRDSLAAVVQAARALHEQLRKLAPGSKTSISQHLLHMRVVSGVS